MKTQSSSRRQCGVVRPVWAFVVILAISFPLVVLGQMGKSGVSGTITDQSGAAVPEASLTVRNKATNIEWKTVTGASGAYFVQNLPVGEYVITVEATNFKKTVVDNVVTEVEKVSSIDILLEVGELTQTIEVGSQADLITATSGTVGTLIGKKEIDTLPLNGRSWVSLNFLTPGATPFRSASQVSQSSHHDPEASVGFVTTKLD